MKPVFEYFLFYFLLLVFGSVIINGWFGSTRGKLDIKPDGTVKKKGYIFKGWYFFWMKEFISICDYYMYKGADLAELLVTLQATTGIKLQIEQDKNPTSFTTVTEFKNHILYLQKRFGILIKHSDTATGILATVYKEEKKYMFPAWVRDIMAGCITCHASVYGTLVFVLFHLQLKHEFLTVIYSPFHSIGLAIISTWLAFVFSLAYLNTVLWKKFGYNG